MMRSQSIAALSFVASMLTVLGEQSIPMEAAWGGVKYSRDGKFVTIVGEDRQVRIWDLASAKFTKSIETQPAEMYVFLAASGSACASITTNGVGRIHDAETGRAIAQCELPVSATFGGAMASTAESDLIAVAGGDPKTSSGNRIQVVDRSGNTRFQVPAGVGGISAMAFSPDGSTLAAVGYDADVRVWDARTGNLQHVIEELKVAMFDTAFSPDGKVLVTAGADRTVYLWDTQTWKLRRKITGQPETITLIRFSPDGTMLVTGGMNERNFNAPVTVILWDFATGRKIQTWTAEHSVRALSFSPDGQQLAFADGTKQVKLLAVPHKRSTGKH